MLTCPEPADHGTAPETCDTDEEADAARKRMETQVKG
jgi:hypothetical protein